MVELDILISTVLGHHEVCSPGHNSKYEVYCVGGSYLTARVLMLPVVTISTEMNTRNCVVSVLHIAARTQD